MRFVKYILVIVLAVVVLGLIVYGGMTIYSCAADRPTVGIPDMPEFNEASHSLFIENTGNLLLLDDYEIMGNEVGQRVFTLYGFWEMKKGDFAYNDGELILDERIFGPITFKKRGG